MTTEANRTNEKRVARCAYEGCERPVETWARGRDEGYTTPKRYCLTHGQMVADQGSPEYTVSCPHCGCDFGVN